MRTCDIQDSGNIELFFYGELDAVELATLQQHLRSCAACAEALRELETIRAALAARPQVSAPPGGDWSRFMARLDASVRQASPPVVIPFEPRQPAPARRSWTGLLATAALLALVAVSVFFASRAGRTTIERPAKPESAVATSPAGPASAGGPVRAGLASVGLRHIERSKLVVLGLAAKDGASGSAEDWEYERGLATALLNDTRLYRMAAEERGLTSLASVMKDLELVLLQASMAETTDRAALPQIQRLIQKRGLVQKMDVATTGLLP